MSTWRRALVALGAALALAGCSPSGGGSGDDAARGDGPTSAAAQHDRKAQDRAQAEALETLVAEQQASLDAVLASDPGLYADATMTAIHPGTIEFAYVYASTIDPSLAVTMFDAMIPTMQEQCDAQVFVTMERAGIADPSVIYTYLNPDGSTVWSHTFTSS